MVELSQDQSPDEFVKMLRIDRLDRAVLEAMLDRLLANVVPDVPLLLRLTLLGEWSMCRARTHREPIHCAQLALKQVRMCPAVE